MDIHKAQFVQIQSHLLATAFDLSAHIAELRTSKFTAKTNSNSVFHRKAFDPQRHLGSGVREDKMQR